MPRKKRQRIHLIDQHDTIILDMGQVEIWDGADLALLRETITQLVHVDKRTSLTIQMQHVKYVPSGFFGMLLDCFDRGVEIALLAPTDYVAGMLWFKQFFKQDQKDLFLLHSGPEAEVPHDQPLPWADADDQEIWDANARKNSLLSSHEHKQ